MNFFDWLESVCLSGEDPIQIMCSYAEGDSRVRLSAARPRDGRRWYDAAKQIACAASGANMRMSFGVIAGRTSDDRQRR